MRAVIFGFFAALPLQWFALGSTPLGTARLHQVAILALATLLLLRYRLRAHAPVIRVAAPFIVANLYMLTIWAAVDLYNGKVPTGPVQEYLYLAACVGISTYVYRVARGKEPGMIDALRWAAAVTCASLLIGFTVAMVTNGVNPAGVLARTVATADPEVFQKEVFKSSFAGFGLEAEQVQGNLRHEIFGSLLLSMLVSTWAMRFGGPASATQRIAYRVSMVLGVALLTLSLSRSVLIAALMWPLMLFFRAVRMGRLSGRHIAVVMTSAVVFGVLAVSGFGAVIWNRFTTDTTGYEARAENYGGAFVALQENWLTGGVDTGGLRISSHNFVIDNWLRGGIFTAIPAAVMLAILCALLFRLVWQLPRLPDWMVPVAAALVVPIVRMGTAGGGLIPPVEWVSLALVAGVLAMRVSQRDTADREPAPAHGPPPRLPART